MPQGAPDTGAGPRENGLVFRRPQLQEKHPNALRVAGLEKRREAVGLGMVQGPARLA